MGIKYRKEFMKGDGRILSMGGPRDSQRQLSQQQAQAQAGDVTELLKEEISKFREELQITQSKSNNLFTAEQVDSDINRVVNETVKELTIKHKSELEQQKLEFKKLISIKDELIVDLKDQNKFLVESLCKLKESNTSEVTEKAGLSQSNVDKQARPVIEKIVIDPLESGAGDGLESHISVKDISITQKEDIKSKVGKLKDLLGGLKT